MTHGVVQREHRDEEDRKNWRIKKHLATLPQVPLAEPVAILSTRDTVRNRLDSDGPIPHGRPVDRSHVSQAIDLEPIEIQLPNPRIEVTERNRTAIATERQRVSGRCPDLRDWLNSNCIALFVSKLIQESFDFAVLSFPVLTAGLDHGDESKQ